MTENDPLTAPKPSFRDADRERRRQSSVKAVAPERCPIRVLRIARGWSQYDLADRLPTTHVPDISCWENGKVQPNPLSIHKLAELFEISAQALHEQMTAWRALYLHPEESAKS